MVLVENSRGNAGAKPSSWEDIILATGDDFASSTAEKSVFEFG